MYHAAGCSHLRDRRRFSQIAVDFNDSDPVGFWNLGGTFSEVPAVKLGKRKRYHKWGILAMLVKRKMMLRAREADSSLTWQTMTWRPLVSAYDNVWKRWFSLAGRTLNVLARIVWPKRKHGYVDT